MLTKVLKNLSIYSVAPIVTGIIGFFLLPIKTNYLSPTDYGILGLLSSFSNIVAIFISLQIGSGILRIYNEVTTEDGKKEYIGSIFAFLTFFAAITTLVVGIIFYYYFDKVFNENEISFYPYLFMQLIIIFFNQFTILPSTIYVVKQQAAKKVILGLAGFAIETIVSLYLIIQLQMGAKGMLLATLISGLVFLPVYIYITFRYAKVKFKFSYIKDTIIYSVPFIPATLGSVIYSYSDRYIIGQCMDVEAVGIYTFAQTLVGPLAFILASLDSAFIPNYYENRIKEVNQNTIKEMMGKLSIFLGLGVIAWVYFISDIKYFINVRYIKAFDLITFFAMFWFFRYLYIFPAAVILYYKKTKYIPFVNLIPAFVNVGLNLVLVPFIGLYGAVLTTLICALITLCLTHYFALKIEKDNFNFREIVALSIIVTSFVFLNHIFSGWNSIGLVLTIKIISILMYFSISAFIFHIPLYSLVRVIKR